MDTLGLVLPLVAFLAAMGLVLAVTNLFGAEREVLQERLTGYGQPTGHTMAIGGTGSTILKEREFSGIPLVQSLLSGSSFADQWAVDLVAAGLPLRVGEYLLLRWISAIAFAAVALLAGLPSLFAIPAAVLGFYVPKFYVGFKQQQRVGKFNDQLVDALSMMANALKSGSSFLQAIDLVARELPAPVSEEFGQVVAEVSVGAGLDEALTNLTKRIKSYDLYLVVTAMIIQRQTGGSTGKHRLHHPGADASVAPGPGPDCPAAAFGHRRRLATALSADRSIADHTVLPRTISRFDARPHHARGRVRLPGAGLRGHEPSRPDRCIN